MTRAYNGCTCPCHGPNGETLGLHIIACCHPVTKYYVIDSEGHRIHTSYFDTLFDAEHICNVLGYGHTVTWEIEE